MWEDGFLYLIIHLLFAALENSGVTKYFLVCNKKSQFDFADELKVGDVRYKHLTQITITVQLFWRLPYEM